MCLCRAHWSKDTWVKANLYPSPCLLMSTFFPLWEFSRNSVWLATRQTTFGTVCVKTPHTAHTHRNSHTAQSLCCMLSLFLTVNGDRQQWVCSRTRSQCVKKEIYKWIRLSKTCWHLRGLGPKELVYEHHRGGYCCPPILDIIWAQQGSKCPTSSQL